MTDCNRPLPHLLGGADRRPFPGVGGRGDAHNNRTDGLDAFIGWQAPPPP